MTIEKFEVGKKYKLVDKEGWILAGNDSNDNEYYGFNTEDDTIVFTRVDRDGDGWVDNVVSVTFSDEAHLFELVEEEEEISSTKNGINWRDAPEGFDFYIISEIAPEGNGFHKLSDCGTLYLDEGGFNFGVIDEGITVYKRPQIVPDNNVDAIETQTEPTTLTGKETTLEALREAKTSVNVCPLQALQQLCSENDINIEVQNCGDSYVHLAHSDESYKVKDMEELTSVLDAVKFLESFKGE